MPSSLVAELDSYDKENRNSFDNTNTKASAFDKNNLSDLSSKLAPPKTKRSAKFTDLLSNASSDIRKDEDCQVAHSIQRAEYQSISNEWTQEILGTYTC